VIATVRRLLVGAADLEAIIAVASALGGELTSSDLDAALSKKLNLPDIRVLRFDVPNSAPVTSNDVYAAFLKVFRAAKLAEATDTSLSAAYAAFKPVLERAYPINPFSSTTSTCSRTCCAPTTNFAGRVSSCSASAARPTACSPAT